jgi:broad specificity phosphatase PhoE
LHPGGRVLVVTHNTLIRVALCQLLSIPLLNYRTAFPAIANAALSEIRLRNGQCSLLKFNVPLEYIVGGNAEAAEPDVPL